MATSFILTFGKGSTMDSALPQSKDTRGEQRAYSSPKTSSSSAQGSSARKISARMAEGRSNSSSMFMTGKVLALPHHAVIKEADAKTNPTCCPCFRSAPKAENDVPNATIPPEAHFKNGGHLAYRNQVAQQEKTPCVLL
jgi:hypothetical protein